MISIVLIFFSILTDSFKPKNGDLLFQDVDCGPICEAIESVTYGYDGACLSHVGLVIEKKDGIYILEALSDGVTLKPLSEFLERSKDSSGNPKVIVGRLKSKYRHILPKAVEEAETYLGKPYDNHFILDNGTYYCSEIIYLAFKTANKNQDFFPLAPMTFKQPGSDTFFTVWEEYYYNLGIEIPEGQPGINPGLISRSEKIEIVHIYGNPGGLAR